MTSQDTRPFYGWRNGGWGALPPQSSVPYRRAKLNSQQRQEIRQALRDGTATIAELALRYKVTTSTIRNYKD